MGRPEADRQRAVLKTAMAEQLRERDSAEALALAREAIKLAIDYDGMIDITVAGNGKKQASPIPNGFTGSADLALPAQDIEKAKALMAEAERKAIEAGEPGIKAKMLKIGAVDYEQYLKLKAKRKRIDEHIRIAKKRERHPDF